MSYTIEGPSLKQAALCEPILRSLPAWFGIEEAILQYLADIDRLPTFLAMNGSQALGFLTVKQHFPESAEILVMGCLPDQHRGGIGRALIDRAETWLSSQGVAYLQVKTLSPTHRDKGYADTRAFYRALGFQPLEEFKKLWDEANPCLLMIKKIGGKND